MTIPVSTTLPTTPGYYYARRGFLYARWQVVKVASNAAGELCYYSQVATVPLNRLEPGVLFSASLAPAWLEGTEHLKQLKGNP